MFRTCSDLCICITVGDTSLVGAPGFGDSEISVGAFDDAIVSSSFSNGSSSASLLLLLSPVSRTLGVEMFGPPFSRHRCKHRCLARRYCPGICSGIVEYLHDHACVKCRSRLVELSLLPHSAAFLFWPMAACIDVSDFEREYQCVVPGCLASVTKAVKCSMSKVYICPEHVHNCYKCRGAAVPGALVAKGAWIQSRPLANVVRPTYSQLRHS